ncbi:hypothetical protein LguiA_029475 [Lonicera macranthoides]
MPSPYSKHSPPASPTPRPKIRLAQTSATIRCFGEETTICENGEMAYNLLLEYGSGETLADLIKKSNGKGLPESKVKCYNRSILKVLYHIHGCGYVHCDLKPDNILLCLIIEVVVFNLRQKLEILVWQRGKNITRRGNWILIGGVLLCIYHLK